MSLESVEIMRKKKKKGYAIRTFYKINKKVKKNIIIIYKILLTIHHTDIPSWHDWNQTH